MKVLISVSKLVKDNYVFSELHHKHGDVKSQVTNEVLVQCFVGLDGLYFLPNIHLQHSSVGPTSCFITNLNNYTSVNSCCTSSSQTLPC